MKYTTLFSNASTRFANLVLGGFAFVCATILGYVVFHRAWFPAEKFASFTAELGWYFVPAALTVMSPAFFRFKPAIKAKLAYCLLALIFVLYAVEVYLSYLPRPLSQPVVSFDTLTVKRKHAIIKLARKAGVHFNTRDRVQEFTDLRSKGVDVVLRMLPRDLLVHQSDGSVRSSMTIHGNEVMPLGGVGNRPTLFCNESGDYIIYGSDQHGFRNPSKIWTSSSLQVAAVGNSFGSGGCVRPGKSFVELIRHHYPATLNLAMGGDGPLLELATLKEYLPSFRPRIVLWLYEEDDDLLAIKTEKNSGLLRRYFKSNFKQGLLGLQSEIDQFLLDHVDQEMAALRRTLREAKTRQARASLKRIIERLKLTSLRNEFGIQVWEGDAEYKIESSELDLFRNVLLEAKTVVNGWNGTLYLVYLPAYRRYVHNLSPGGKARDLVLNLVSRLGIRTIDIHPLFQSQKDPLSLFPFRQFVHYNKRGHELVARELLRALSRAHSNHVDSGVEN